MPGRQAKLITPFTLRRMLSHIRHAQDPARDRVMILLSVKAGLRAAEIAGLDWPMVLDARACIGDTITIRDGIAKKQSGRKIPMHPGPEGCAPCPEPNWRYIGSGDTISSRWCHAGQ